MLEEVERNKNEGMLVVDGRKGLKGGRRRQSERDERERERERGEYTGRRNEKKKMRIKIKEKRDKKEGISTFVGYLMPRPSL